MTIASFSNGDPYKNQTDRISYPKAADIEIKIIWKTLNSKEK